MSHAPLHGSHLFPQSVRLLCLGVWEPSGHDSSVWVIKHTHAVISTTPSQNRLEALRGILDRVSVTTGLFSDSLHYNTFQNMPTAVRNLPKPFRLLFGSVNIASQHTVSATSHRQSGPLKCGQYQEVDLKGLVSLFLNDFNDLLWRKDVIRKEF